MIVLGILLALAVGACKPKPDAAVEQPEIPDGTPAPTEVPAAVRVNGEGIPLADFEAEMQRYQAGMSELGETVDPEIAQQTVLDYLTSQVLLAQAAAVQGYQPQDGEIQAVYDGLVEDVGGNDALNLWISQNYFSDESFRRALAQDLAAVWMRNKILADVPKTADQIHARQILVKSENEAIAVERQLQVGKDFTALAFEYDSLTGGDLGWFPSGYLLQPDVENAAFALQPGQFSGVIPTSYGYHLVFVIERDAQHQLSPEALLSIQRRVFEKWLNDRIAQSTIEVLVP